MSRGALALDRFVAGLLGLLLLAGAAWLIAWTAGALPAGLTDPDEVRVGGGALARLPQEAWWSAAVGLGGFTVASLGLLWLLGHVRSRAVGRLVLPGGGSGEGSRSTPRRRRPPPPPSSPTTAWTCGRRPAGCGRTAATWCSTSTRCSSRTPTSRRSPAPATP